MIEIIYDNYFLFIFPKFSTIPTCCFYNQRYKVMLFEKLKSFMELMICVQYIYAINTIKRCFKINKSRDHHQ